MVISPEKQRDLLERMQRLGIREQDLLEKFILGSGKGGQKVNKTASTVYLKHIPTATEVKCQQERSREMNRFFARRRLCELVEEKLHGTKSSKQMKIEKIQKQKKRRKRLQNEGKELIP